MEGSRKLGNEFLGSIKGGKNGTGPNNNNNNNNKLTLSNYC